MEGIGDGSAFCRETATPSAVTMNNSEILHPTWSKIFFIQQLYPIIFLCMFRASQRSSLGGYCMSAVSDFLTLVNEWMVLYYETGILVDKIR
jgi:hypothetical protein